MIDSVYNSESGQPSGLCALSCPPVVSVLFIGVLAEFDQRTDGRLGVEECDVEAFGALAGSFVDEAAAFGFDFVERVLHAVGDCECHVLYATAAAVVFDEFRDGAFGCGAFEEFELGLAYFEEGGANFLVGNFFDCEALQA